MDVNSILTSLSGAELQELRIVSDCIVNGARELCVTVRLRCNDTVAQNKRVKTKDHIAAWLVGKYKIQKRSTYDRLESTVTNQILPAFGEMYLDEISTEYAQSILDDYADYYSYSTLTKTYQCLNAFLKDAQRHHIIVENPMDLIVMPKNDGRTLRDIVVYSPDECARIVDTAMQYKNSKLQDPLAPLLPFLLHTGLRIGEALALRWADVDEVNHFVRIRKNVKVVKNRNGGSNEPHYIIVEDNTPKTKSSLRTVPLNHSALAALEALPSLHNPTELIFPMRNGNHLSYASARRMLERVCKRANVSVRGFHAFRHTFATNLFANGVEVKTVSKILGHSSVKITYDIYIHSIQEQEARAVALIE